MKYGIANIRMAFICSTIKVQPSMGSRRRPCVNATTVDVSSLVRIRKRRLRLPNAFGRAGCRLPSEVSESVTSRVARISTRVRGIKLESLRLVADHRGQSLTYNAQAATCN